MSWGLVAVAGATIVGSKLQSDAAKKAANQQGQASQDAANAQLQGAAEAKDAWSSAVDQSTDLQNQALGQYRTIQDNALGTSLDQQTLARDSIRSGAQPYMDTGLDALSRLRQMLDINPTPDAASVMAEPGYQFGLQQGLNATQGTAAARGGLYSGQALKELTQYGNDYATTKYGDAWNRAQTDYSNRWNRISGLMNMGRDETARVGASDQAYANNVGNLVGGNANRVGSAMLDNAGNRTALLTGQASALGNLATGTANNLGNIWTNNANAQGTNALQQGQIWSNGINQLAGIGASYLGRSPTSTGTGVGTGGGNIWSGYYTGGP